MSVNMVDEDIMQIKHFLPPSVFVIILTLFRIIWPLRRKIPFFSDLFLFYMYE